MGGNSTQPCLPLGVGGVARGRELQVGVGMGDAGMMGGG